MTRLINVLALVTALTISGVTAYFSVLGLTAIFHGSWYAILVMGTVLEVGKVVTAAWLHINWYRDIPRSIKYYLTAATVVLMLITSMGVYGFLSKSHVDQQVKLSTGVAQEIQLTEIGIKNSKKLIEDLDSRIKQYDDAIRDGSSKLIEQGKVKNAQNLNVKPRQERDKLNKERLDEQRKLLDLEAKKVQQDAAVKQVEAEVGPIKYVASLLFSDASHTALERAVRWMIVVLVIVFDPLAIALLLGSTHSFFAAQQPVLEEEIEDGMEAEIIDLPKRRRGRPPKTVEIADSMIFKKVPEKEE